MDTLYLLDAAYKRRWQLTFIVMTRINHEKGILLCPKKVKIGLMGSRNFLLRHKSTIDLFS